MDEYSSRRASGGPVVSRRGPSLLKYSTENNRDRNVQVCSRAGCASRSNQMKDAQVGSPNKAKPIRTPFRSAHGKEVVGSSSRSPLSLNTSRKHFTGSKKKISFHLESDSETSSIQEDSEEASESSSRSGKTQTRVHPEPDEQEADTKSAEAGTSTSAPTSRPVKRKTQRLGVGRQDSGAGYSSSFGFNQTNQVPRNGTSTSRYSLRNLRCNSTSDVVPSGCSSSPDSNSGRKRDTGRKRIGEPESSLPARGKKINGPILDDRRNDNINRAVSISDSRPTRNFSPVGHNGAASVGNRRSTIRTRLSNQESRNRMPLVESPLRTPSSPQPDTSLDADALSSENEFSAQTPSYNYSSFSRSGTSIDSMRPNRSIGPYSVGASRSLMSRDSLRQYGIAEMLLALDRIEQDDEPTYEQLLVMETNLFLGGLAFQDQHRDMRLDIDNMSYEELLALGERMGTVNTAVPEDVLAKCLERSIYQGITDCRKDADDVKCCICQEEYADGDEMGRLGCDHRYHTDCVNQWLRLKNWCPICKASATSPPSTSPPP